MSGDKKLFASVLTVALLGYSGGAMAEDVSNFSDLKSALMGGATSIALLDNVDFEASFTSTDRKEFPAYYAITGDGFVLSGKDLYSGFGTRNGNYTNPQYLSIGDGLTFQNFSSTQNGAAIRTQYSSQGSPQVFYYPDLIIGDRVTFKNNITETIGGAISAAGSITIGNDVTFTNNTASSSNTTDGGGAISGWKGVLTIADRATFTENKAGGMGGGAISRYNAYDDGGHGMLLGDYATFKGNKNINKGNATYGGGAILSVIYANGSGTSPVSNSITLGTNADFTENQAVGAGGAILQWSAVQLAVAATNTIATGVDSKFADNKATGGAGGAIYQVMQAYTNDLGDLTNIMSLGARTTLSGNSSSAAGGAIYQDIQQQYAGTKNNNNTMNIGAGSTFSGNTATGNGGAIYSRIYSDANFTGNDTNTLNIGDSVTFSGNTAAGTGIGGAINFQVYHLNATGDAVGKLNITTTGGTTKFTGNTDSKGANDIYLNGTAEVDMSLNINGSSGETVFEGGIGNADAIASTTSINKSNGGVLTFGKDAVNSGFTGTFNQTGGTTNVYGELFKNAVINNITGGLLHFFNSSDAGKLFVANASVSLQSDVAGQYNTLTVSDWIATNAKLYLNTFFDGNGTNTDKLVVDGGDVSGVTTLYINSVGTNNVETPEGSEGILIANLAAAASNTATFVLDGGAVDTGALKYIINDQAADGNIYLKSDGRSDVGNTINNMPALHLSIVKVGMNELRKRLGDLRSNGDGSPSTWVRTYGKHLKVDEKIEARMNLFGMEAGVDVKLGDFYVGVMGGYLNSNDVKINQTNSSKGKGDANVPSVGMYATWLSNGWFADAVIRHFWVNMDMKNIAANGAAIAYEADRNFIAGSLEGGKQFVIDKFVFEPKLEVQYIHADAKSFATNFNDVVRYKDTDSLMTRVAAQFSYQLEGEASKWKPFAEVALYNEWLGETKIDFAGVGMKSDVGGVGFDLTVGLDAKLADDVHFYGDVSFERGSVYESVSTNIGLRYNF